MQNKRKKILWLVSWYPNKYDHFDGDFIQRHARAAALYDDIHVLFVKPDERQKEVEVSCSENEGVSERIVYVPKQKGWLAKLPNLLRWKRIYEREVCIFIEKNHPPLIHVHVPWKAGLIALWVKRRYRLPFLVTEHWGIYNNVVDDNIHTRSLFFRVMLKKIYREAKAVISVSHFLGHAISEQVVEKKYAVVPNVVDTTLFFPGSVKAEPFTFLHVSNMVPLKNVDGILLAFRAFLTQTDLPVQLVLVGNKEEKYVQLAHTLGFPEATVFFRGEVPYGEVASQMQQAHVLVLNSDMENSPCVIGEALCCGLPVIATNVGGIPELVTDENSILVPPRNTEALSEAFFQVIKNYHRFRPVEIASSAQKTFGLKEVGSRLHQLYK